MAVSDIDQFREQLPQVFEDRRVPPGWEDDWMVIPIPKPEDAAPLEDIERDSPDDARLRTPDSLARAGH